MLVRLAFLCVLQLTLNSNVFAQDIVTDCDKYAASETDPNAKAPGVLLERVNAALAVPACTAAVRQSPNNARLLFQLGRAYQTDNKLNLALEYFRKAAEKNYAAAQESLGDMYTTGLLLDGQGVPPDDQQAATWYRRAAEQGLPSAQSKLAALGVAQNAGPQNSQERPQQPSGPATPPAPAAAGSLKDATVAFDRGDYATASRLFRPLADQGDAMAQFNLANMYDNGQGVPRDAQQAAAWYRKVAEQGLPLAQSKLAALGVAEATPKGCALGSPTSGRILVKMSGVNVMQGPGADTTRVINKLASQGGQTFYYDLRPSDNLEALCEVSDWVQIKTLWHGVPNITGWIEKRLATRELTDDQKHGLYWDIADWLKLRRECPVTDIAEQKIRCFEDRNEILPDDEDWLRKGALRVLSDDVNCKRIDSGDVRPRDRDGKRYHVTCSGNTNRDSDLYNVFFDRADIISGKPLMPPQPYDERASRKLCEAEIKNRAEHPSTVNIYGVMGYATKTYGTGLRRIWQDFSAKNTYNLELTYTALCEISPNGNLEISIRERH